MLTERQKAFILDNIDVLDVFELQQIVEDLIDNMKKDYATKLVSKIIEYLNDSSYLSMFDTF